MPTTQREPLSANLTAISRKSEAAFAAIPNAGGNATRADEYPASAATGWAGMRAISESLEGQSTTVQSGEIDGTNMIPDLIRTNLAASGTTNHEFTQNDYDDIILGNLGHTAINTFGSQTTHTIASGSIDDSSGVLELSSTSVDTDFAVDDWIYIDSNHTSDARVHGFHRITATTSGTVTLETPTPSGVTSVSLTTGAGILNGAAVANGTNFWSWSIIREWGDAATTFFEGFRGMVPNTITWDCSPGAIVRFNVDWVGADLLAPTTTDPISGSPASGTASPMTTPSNMNVRLAGIEVGAARLQMSISMGAEPRQRLGFLGARSVARRTTNPQMQIDFDIEDFLDDDGSHDDFIAKFRNETAFNAAAWFRGASAAYVIELPAARIENTRNPIEGRNTDLLQRMNVTGIKATLADSSQAAVRVHKWTTLSTAA